MIISYHITTICNTMNYHHIIIHDLYIDTCRAGFEWLHSDFRVASPSWTTPPYQHNRPQQSCDGDMSWWRYMAQDATLPVSCHQEGLRAQPQTVRGHHPAQICDQLSPGKDCTQLFRPPVAKSPRSSPEPVASAEHSRSPAKDQLRVSTQSSRWLCGPRYPWCERLKVEHWNMAKLRSCQNMAMGQNF